LVPCSETETGGLRNMKDSLGCSSIRSLAELVDGTGCSLSECSSSFKLDECNQLTNHVGCGSNPVTDSVTRLNIDFGRSYGLEFLLRRVLALPKPSSHIFLKVKAKLLMGRKKTLGLKEGKCLDHTRPHAATSANFHRRKMAEISSHR